MADSEPGTSSDAARALGDEHQVFLSFRGSDTRYDFTDFLYNGLVDAGIHVFKDDEELHAGEVIGGNLLKAIDNSIIYIPIFSRTYASSKWCLRELAHMVKDASKPEGKKSILPIFFKVRPDDVKLKTPLYGDTLLQHEKEFPREVVAWRAALVEVGKIKGWEVPENESQAKIVKLVVEAVLEKLRTKQKSVTEHLVGLDDRVKDLIDFLNVKHDDVRLIGIYGMGGIGKTTIAKVVFNKLCSHFGKCCSFLEDVRETSTKEGIVQLQKKLLSDIVGSRSVEKIGDSEEGMRRIGEILRNKKVLVVMDDVNEKDHIRKLIGNSKLHLGSKVIITTRDTAVLEVDGFKGKTLRYEMQKMDDGPALQLFCRHAFGKYFPSEGYCRLSSAIVSRTGGLPLAIAVIGSLLNGREEAFWEETLGRLSKVSEGRILEKLRISYDKLDKCQQQIFLDIACFIFNEKKTDAIYIWDDYYPIRGIKVLTERCLIKILDNDRFWMHDQLIALGRQIVHEESEDDLGKRSRLWIAKEALQIIGTKEMKHKVQALKISRHGPLIEIRNEDFERLPNLRFLNLERGTYVGDFAGCRSKLRWFSWKYLRMDEFDLDFRADNLHLDQLSVCKLRGLDFENDSKAWDLTKGAQKLRVLSVSYCSNVMTIPNISGCSALERLTLNGCSSLVRIGSYIGHLQSLIDLKIESCQNFKYLPKEVGELKKLERLSLSDCGELRELPSSLENMTSLTELNLSGTKIRELPNSIRQLKSFCVEDDHDWQLPSGIGTLVNLRKLDLSGHERMKGEIPVEIGKWSSLRILNLANTPICGIPRIINKLHHLQTLNLTDCHEIRELPELPTSLTSLLLRSTSLISVPNLSKLTNLVNLLLSDDSDRTGKSNLFPGWDLTWIENLSRLKWLELCLLNASAPLRSAHLSHLEKLVLKCLDLKLHVQIPSPHCSWRNLSTLEFYSCEVEDIPLAGLPRLEGFTVVDCACLQRLSISSGLCKLRQAMVSSCRQLVGIQVVGVSTSLEDLTVTHCDSLTRISGLSDLKNLDRLAIGFCNVLAEVEGLNELESLKSLTVHNCSSLRWLIDASCTKIPDDCSVQIWRCGDSKKKSVENPTSFMKRKPLKRYKEEILQNISNKISFTVRFHLGVKESRGGLGFVGGINREKADVTPDSVTYEGLVADVKNFGFRLKRMWYMTPCVYRDLPREIQSDEQVKGIIELASKRELIHLYVEGGVDSEWEGEYDDKMMEMLTEEWRMKSDAHSDDDGTEWDISHPEEDLDSASTGESETHGTSLVDDFELQPGNAECLEATTSVAEKDLHSVDKQSCQLKGTSAKQGKRQRDDDHASQTNTTKRNSTCGQPSGIPQHVTRMTRSRAAEIQPPVEVAALPAEAVGPSRKKKQNDSKQVNPIRRSARLMKGPTGGTSDIVHLD